MSESFRDELQEEVPRWVEEGVITEQQAGAILERHEATEGRSAGGSQAWTSTLLYGTAAVLLGAAAIALVVVGIDPTDPKPYLMAIGLAYVASGGILAVAAPERDLLADAMLAAGLAPLALATFDDGMGTGAVLGYGLVGLAAPTAYLFLRREQPFLPTLSVIGWTAAAGGSSFGVVSDDAQAAAVWLGLQTGLAILLVGIDRVLREREATTPVALAVVAVAGSLIPFLWETLGIDAAETAELILGAIMLVVLGAGLALRHRGLVVGASVALCIDAIVFAFTVGGVYLGIGVLVSLAAVMIWQADRLQGWVQTSA